MKGIDRNIVHKLDQAWDVACRETHGDIPLKTMRFIFFVALNPGVTQVEISDALGIPEGTVSRHLAKLGSRIQKTQSGDYKPVGFGLIETKTDFDDTRIKRIHLTKKGQKVIGMMTGLFS